MMPSSSIGPDISIPSPLPAYRLAGAAAGLRSRYSVALAVAIAVVLITLLGAGQAQASDADIKTAVRQGFGEVATDYNNMYACRGCSSSGNIAAGACLRWMKALNQTVSFTSKASRGRSAAFEAFRNYSFAATSYSQSYNEAQLGLSQESTDDYDLATAQLKTARRYARTAALLLGLTRYP